MKKTFTAILVAAFFATALHAGAFELETVEPLQTDISHETETESILSVSITPGTSLFDVCHHRKRQLLRGSQTRNVIQCCQKLSGAR